MALDKFGGYTTTTYGYKPELDVALGRLESIAKQYAPGGGLAKTLTTAQESNLQQGKRKSMSNIAQQLVSSGLANTTNLPSAELGYEAEVMAPARTQLDAEIAKMYMDAQMAIAQHMGQQTSQANQMQYGAIQSAMRNVGQGGGGGTGFMQGYGGGGGGYGSSLTGGLNYPGGGAVSGEGDGTTTPIQQTATAQPTTVTPQPGRIETAQNTAASQWLFGGGMGLAPTYTLLNEPDYTTPGGGTATQSEWDLAQARLQARYSPPTPVPVSGKPWEYANPLTYFRNKLTGKIPM